MIWLLISLVPAHRTGSRSAGEPGAEAIAVKLRASEEGRSVDRPEMRVESEQSRSEGVYTRWACGRLIKFGRKQVPGLALVAVSERVRRSTNCWGESTIVQGKGADERRVSQL